MVELPLSFTEAETEGTRPCPQWTVAGMDLESSAPSLVTITLAEQGLPLAVMDQTQNSRPTHTPPSDFQEAPNIQTTPKTNFAVAKVGGSLKHHLKSQGHIHIGSASPILLHGFEVLCPFINFFKEILR